MADDTNKPAVSAASATEKPAPARTAKPRPARPAAARTTTARKRAAPQARTAAPAKQTARKPVSAKPAPARKTAAPAKKATTAKKVAKPAKPKKVKLVRDSFTMPENEYALIAELKKRCLAKGVPAKKSEILRAAVAGLAKLSDASAVAAIRRLPVIKTGRPAKSAK